MLKVVSPLLPFKTILNSVFELIPGVFSTDTLELVQLNLFERDGTLIFNN